MTKVSIGALMGFMVASPLLADADPRYLDAENILADLNTLVGWCDEMSDGQVREEVFGLLFVKNGTRCKFTNGELDDHIRAYLSQNQLGWAGVEGEDGLWVEETGAND